MDGMADSTPSQTISPPSGAIHWLWGRRGLGEELTAGRFGVVAGWILFGSENSGGMEV